MKFFVKLFLELFVVIIIIPALILGYLGFIPLISSVFGSDKPRDLGVKYTESDKSQVYQKNNIEIAVITPTSDDIKDSLRFEGKQDVNIALTGSEITALFNTHRWKYSLSSNVQVKINTDGTGEISGILHIDNVLPYVSLTHSTAEVESAINKYHIGFNPPYYLKGRVEVINNKVTLNPEKIEIGRITIPAKLVSENLSAATDFVETRINAIPNLYVRSLKLEDGTAKIDATYPQKEFVVQN